MTITLREIPARQALDALFRGHPFRYVLSPECAGRRISVEATQRPWCYVLQEALASADLECSREDSVLHVTAAGTARRRRELEYIMRPLSSGKHRLLCVTRHGDRDQVRLRVFPYEGAEAVLWETAAGGSIRYLLPSPDRARALVVWERRAVPEVTVLALRDAAAVTTEGDGGTRWAVWRDPTHVALLVREAGEDVEKTFDVTARKLATLGPSQRQEGLDPELPFITAPFRKEVDTFIRLINDRSLAIPFEPEEAAGAIARGTGIDYVTPVVADIPLAHPVAAVAPDGEHIALTTSRSDSAVFIVVRYEMVKGIYGTRVDQVIPLSQLIIGEAVWVDQMQWSPDGKQLVFTEVHFHPARFHAPDIGGDVPDPTDWTYLVRIWNRDTNRTETIAAGRDGWLIPDGPMSAPAGPGNTGRTR